MRYSIKNRQWHAPAALSRGHPVGTRFNRSRDAVFAPCRDPFHFIVDCFERSATQRVDANEKLIDVAKDDRCFRPPAIWIRMMKLFFAKKHLAVSKQFNNVGV